MPTLQALKIISVRPRLMIDVDTEEKLERRRQHFIRQYRKQLTNNPYYAATKMFEHGGLEVEDIELLKSRIGEQNTTQFLYRLGYPVDYRESDAGNEPRHR